MRLILPRRKLLLAAPALVLPHRHADAQLALPWPGPGTPHSVSGGAAWTLIATAIGSSANTYSTSTVDTSTANLLVIGISQGTTPGTLSDSKSNTWVSNTGLGFADSFGGGEAAIYFVTSPVVGTGHTFTFTGSNIYSAMAVLAFKSASGTPFRDDDAGASPRNDTTGGGAGSLTVTSRTPFVANSIGFTAIVDVSATGASSINQSYNVVTGGLSGGYVVCLAWKILTTTAASNPTWTFGGSSTAAVATGLIVRT